MNFNTMKQIITKSLDRYPFTKGKTPEDNMVNKIIAGCILYETLSTLVQQNSQYGTNISSIAESYAESSRSTAEGLEGTYLSYKTIRNRILNYNITSFLSITEKYIKEILDLYHDKRLIKAFSTTEYSPKMYSVHKITHSQDIYLRYVHDQIMVPIANYYYSTMDILCSDIVVENVLDNNPGKTLKESINGVSPSQISTDINTNKIGILQYIYSVRLTEDGFTQLTMK